MSKNVIVTVIVALVVSLVTGFLGIGLKSSNNLAGLSERDIEAVSLKVGASGSKTVKVISGTCTLVSDSSIAATSTGTGTCAASGVAAGDQVFVSLSTTTTKMAAQYSIVGTVAAANSITVRLLNLTGTAAVPSATSGFGSSTQYHVLRK